MADKDLQVRFGVGHLSYQKKQRTRITYKSPTQINSPWIGVNCSSAEWYQNRGEGVLNLRRDVDTIGGGASTDYSPFYGNTSVTEVVLPNEITNIGDYAFNGCTNLDKVVITSEVPPTLGDNVFEDTTTVYVPYEYLDAYGEAWGDEVEIAPIGDYYQITVTAGEHGSATGSGWYALNESVVLTATADEGYEFTQWSDGNTDNPRTITVLGDATYTCAFQALKLIRYTSTNQASGQWVTNNTDTTKNTYDSTTHEGVLHLNEGVTTIGGGTSTDYSPFNRDTGLTAVDLDDAGLTNIGMQAFSGCTGLTSINIPSGVTTIGESAFQNCTGLTSINIPNSVTSIGTSAFGYCTGLTSLTIGSGVTTIGQQAFQRCSSLTSITIPNSVTTIGQQAFQVCSGLTSLTIGSGVTSIGYGAFYACSALASITVDSNNTYYNDGNGSNCLIQTSNNELIKGSNNSVIPSGVTTIGESAFSGCSGLTSITMPSGLTTIGNGAFVNCTGLTSISIPSSVTSIGGSAFGGCTNLVSVIGLENTSITQLKSGTFQGCSSLTTISLPSTLTSMSDEVFSGCTNLVSVIGLENTSITQLEGNQFRQGVFQGCSSLTTISLPSTLTTISGYYNSFLISNSNGAFKGCSSLTSITIPSSVTSINNCAFYGCNNLTSVTCEATTPPTLGSANFNTSGDTLYVPAASVSAYQSASAWSSAFTTITAIPVPAQHTISYTTDDPQYGASAVDGNWVTNNTDTTQNTYATVAGQYGNTGEGVLYLNSGVTTIGGGQSTAYSPFYESGLNHWTNSIDLSDSGLTSIGDYGLYDSNVDFHQSNPLVIPEGVTTIGDHGLGASSTGGNDCYYDLPSTLTSIASNGIYIGGSKGAIAVLICRATTPPTLGTNSISAPDGLWTLQVPAASVSAYQSSAWGSLGFSTITAIS